MDLLLAAGAEVNKGNNNGIRAIHLAAYRDNIIGLEKLLKAQDIDIHVGLYIRYTEFYAVVDIFFLAITMLAINLPIAIYELVSAYQVIIYCFKIQNNCCTNRVLERMLDGL